MATVRKRGNSYTIRAYDGYDSNGRQIERSMTWTPPEGMSETRIQKELERVKIHFEDNIKNGIYANKRIKFSDFAQKWLTEYAEQQLSPKTVQGYKEQLPLVNDEIGHLYLDKIRPNHLMKLRDNLLKHPLETKYKFKGSFHDHIKKHGFNTLVQFSNASGLSLGIVKYISSGKTTSLASAEKVASCLQTTVSSIFIGVSTGTLSPNSVKHYMHLVSSIFRTAVEWQYIPVNPMERVSMPKCEENHQLCLTREQAIQLLNLLETAPEKYKTAVTILLLTGMRREELLALKWNDIDWDNQVIHIHGGLQYIQKKGLVYTPPKTHSSNRFLKATRRVIDVLQNYHTSQEQSFATLGDAMDDDRYIFSDMSGNVLRPNTLTAWFRHFIDKTDLPPIHLHSLRHTNATLLLENQMSPLIVSGALGHANANVTHLVYAHAIQSAIAKAADEMENILAQ